MRIPLLLVAIISAAGAGLSACTVPTDDRQVPREKTTRIVVATSTASMLPAPEIETFPVSSAASATLRNSGLDISGVTSSYGGEVGVAIVSETGTQSAGTLLSDVAWSTIKVPIALAAARNGTASPDVVSAALRSSDNSAALSLWDSLGTPEVAGQRVMTEIAEVAPSPTINTVAIRSGFTTFGQTQWSLVDQAEFGANLPCHPYISAVAADLENIVPSQSYGLGILPGASFKGGWGPDSSGQYLVRQFGYIKTADGRYGVAIAAKAGDGSYATGQAMLTRLAELVSETMPSGLHSCE